MVMENDFNTAGDALLAYGPQTTGYPKLVNSDGSKTTMTIKYVQTASLPDGTTGTVTTYDLQAALNVTSLATVTNTVGTPDDVEFQFTSKKVCNLIRVNETAHDLSTAVIEVSNNGTTWTTISATNIQLHDDHYDLEFTNNTGYLYYRFTLATLTSISTSEVSIYLNDKTVKVEQSPDYSDAGVNAGEVRYYKAPISGFDGTATDIETEGWTRITGTTDLGQSATELVIIDNGLVRCILNKNLLAIGSAENYMFNGTAWKRLLASDSAMTEFTLTSIEKNSTSQFKASFSFDDGVAISTGEVSVSRGIPSIEWTITALTSDAGQDWRWLWGDAVASADKWTYIAEDSTGVFASDSYGLTSPDAYTPAGSLNAFVAPITDFGLLAVIAYDSDEPIAIDRVSLNGFNYQSLVAADLPAKMWIGAVPYSPTIPSTLDSEIGNTDGQLIEAESYYAWEGETPLIGENLLTNGDFETDLTGWTWSTTPGPETRITTEQKFGTASLQIAASPGQVFYQEITGLEVGATYAVSGWIRTVDLTAGTGRINVALTFAGSSLANTDVSPGKEWTYASGIWLATQSNVFVRCTNGASSTGNAQYDGISLVKVKNADGTSALAFDTTSTTGWSGVGSISDAPRGKAVVSTGGSVSLAVGNQDWSSYRRISFWARSTANNSCSLDVRDSSGAWSIVVGGGSGGLITTPEWKYFVFGIQGATPLGDGRDTTAQDWTEITDIRVTNLIAGTEFANFRLSSHDPSIGAGHSLLHTMEDDIVGWWKNNEYREVTGIEGTPVWEGETPLIGENLLTNGDFQTDSPGSTITGWVESASGNWDVINTESKFGTQCAEGPASGLGHLRQEFTPVVGDTYALIAWNRSADTTGASTGVIRITKDAAMFEESPVFTEGKEWNYNVLLFTPDASATWKVELGQNSPSTGPTQFDGIQLIKVKNADGTSALAFDTTSTDGWTPTGTSTVNGIVDAPRGSAISITATADFTGAEVAFDPQDISQFRFVNYWARQTGGDGSAITGAFRITGGTGQSNWGHGITTEWQFYSREFNPNADAAIDARKLYFEKSSTGTDLTFELSNITLSRHRVSVGGGHGILHPMEDDIVGWWKGVQSADSMGDPVPFEDGDEKVTNGGFETYTSTPGVPDSWTDNSSATTTLTKETTVIRTGSNALNATTSGSPASGRGIIQQVVSGLTSGKSYLAEAWVRTDGSSGARARFVVQNSTDAANIELLGTTDIATYEKLSTTFYVDDNADTWTLYITFNASTPPANATLYIDDVSVKEITAGDSSGEDESQHFHTWDVNIAGPEPFETDPWGGTKAIKLHPQTCVGVRLQQTVMTAGNEDEPFTLAAWFRADGNASSAESLLVGRRGFHGGIQSTSANKAFRFKLYDDNAATTYATGSYEIVDSNYHHFVATYGGGSGSRLMTLYVDGVLIDTEDFPSSGLFHSSHSQANGNFTIGGFDTRTLDGAVADVRVMSRALGAKEVADLYNAGTPETIAGWVGQDDAVILSLTTTAQEGSKALSVNGGNQTDHGLELVFDAPQDLSNLAYLSFWYQNLSTPTAGQESFNLSVRDADGGLATWNYAAEGSENTWVLLRAELASPDSGSVDLTKITTIEINDLDRDSYIDALKLTSLDEVADWQYEVESDADEGYIYTNTGGTTTAASGDRMAVTVDIATAGDYDVSFFARSGTASQTLDVTVNGAGSTVSGSLPTGAWSALTTANVITITGMTFSAGENTVEFETNGTAPVEIGPRVMVHSEGSDPFDTFDSSGEANLGTLTDGTALMPKLSSVVDPWGTYKAVSFDGIDDDIQSTGHAAGDINEGTISVWTKWDAGGLDGTLRMVIDINRTGTDGLNIQKTTSGDKLQLQYWSSSSGALRTLKWTDTPTAGVWEHYVVTWDSGGVRTYKDGVLDTEETGEVPGPDTDTDWYLGSNEGVQRYFWGAMADPRVMSRALGAKEVADLYNATSPEIIAGLDATVGTLTTHLSTDSKEGSKALLTTNVGGGSAYQVSLFFDTPQDFSKFTHISGWGKRLVGTGNVQLQFRDITGTSGSSTTRFGTTTSYTRTIIPLTEFAGVDLTQVKELRFVHNGDNQSFLLDGLKLTSLDEVGDWRVEQLKAGTSGGMSLENVSPVAGDYVGINANFPQVGQYYVGIMCQTDGGTATADVGIDGDETDSGGAQTIATTEFTSLENQYLYGPFPITSAGDHNVRLTIDSVSGATFFHIDFITVYPYGETSGSPTTFIGPKNFANSQLKDVNLLGTG